MKITVAIRELRSRLGRYIRQVQAGHEVIVTERGRPVAVLAPATAGGERHGGAHHLAALAARGQLRLGTGFEARVPRGKPSTHLSAAVLRDRSQGD